MATVDFADLDREVTMMAHAGALARSDDGEPAQPGDEQLVAAGDVLIDASWDAYYADEAEREEMEAARRWAMECGEDEEW